MAQFLTDATFLPFVRTSPLPVLVDFYKDGCIPCRRVVPLLSRVEEKYALTIARVNITHNLALVEQYAIEAAPTLVVFQNGVEIARHRGVIDVAGLEALIQNAFRKGE